MKLFTVEKVEKMMKSIKNALEIKKLMKEENLTLAEASERIKNK